MSRSTCNSSVYLLPTQCVFRCAQTSVAPGASNTSALRFRQVSLLIFSQSSSLREQYEFCILKNQQRGVETKIPLYMPHSLLQAVHRVRLIELVPGELEGRNSVLRGCIKVSWALR